jgi:hypothetical protein
MGAGYERSGKHDLPKWWTDLAWPALEKAKYGDVAVKASAHAGRKSAWDSSAITKFKLGTAGRTRELANGISYALGIPQPFFTARSEEEAKSMTGIMRAFDSTVNVTNGQAGRLKALDALEDAERRSALDQTDHVTSADDERAAGRRRTGRTPRRRT